MKKSDVYIVTLKPIPGGINTPFSEAFKVLPGHGYGRNEPNARRTRVKPEDIQRWVANGFVDDDIRDFLFSDSEHR